LTSTPIEPSVHHTPGPWRAVRVAGTSAYPEPIWDIVAGNENAILVNDVGNERDARLMAAAPELLMWLEFAVRRLKDFEGGLSNHATDEIRQVIAKAKGRQP
jgi:hypothetical protein